MIPRFSSKNDGKGTSFKGAALYFMHDKKALTTERVGATRVLNVGTDNPELAWRLMAATALNQNTIKEVAGTKGTGRKTKYTVLHYSLSWHPEDKP
jgi:hypothetical protein